MRANLLIATLLACSAFLPVSAYDGNGLPPVRNSAYMGTPGDGIRSDMGNNISGCRPARAVQQRVGLPQCRNSAYMGQPGDGIRSDLGNNISGKRQPVQSAQRVGLPKVRNSAYMGQPGDGIRSDLGHQISGQNVRRQAQIPQQQRASSPVMINAYGYADYTK